MPDHEKGPCGLGDRCLRPEFEIRAMYKCCFCGFQLHNPLSGCSRPHGEDDDKVKCIDVIKCVERNSASGRCATRPQASDALNSKSSGDKAGGKKRSLTSDQMEPSKIRGDTRRVVMKGKIVVLSAEQSKILDVYENSTVLTRVKEVEREIRIAVRGYVWSHTKFAKGEGSMSRGQMIGCKRIKLVPEFGNSHERPDFTKPSKGYQSLILNHCNYSSEDKSSEDRALFWKSYEDVVKSEIQVKRSSASRAIKTTLQQLLEHGASKMSGCFSSDCYQFQASRNEVVSTSGSSSSESEDNVTINGRGTVNNLNEDQLVRLEQLNAKEKERKEKNKTVARRLIVMASSENGVKEIWKVYEKQVVGGVEAFDSISEDVCDVFNMFIDTCLVHMVPRVTWNKNHMNETLTKLFSIADEAFAMLVLENIAPDLQSDILRSAQGRLVWGDRKNAKPKFTKGGRDSQGKMRGWRYEGIVRYNELVRDVIEWRKRKELREFTEQVLKKRYRLENDEADAAETELNNAVGSGALKPEDRIEPYDLLEGIPGYAV